ncbi:MAG: polysaccharide biosynthesis/export family protein [Bryobacteraceae bacterium]|jgi:polysaccharide export outer membrane protein
MHLHGTLRSIKCFAFILATSLLILAQTPAQQQPPPDTGQNPNQAAPPARELPPDSIRPNYILGPNDQILIRSNAEEINEKPFRIDADGNINLPLVGKVHAGGLSQQELEAEIVRRLKEYIRDPQVIITPTAFRSEPVFFVGAFARPGIYPLQGKRTLVEMLVSIGGLTPNASRHIKVTRRAEYGVIPLPGAIEDPEKKISTVEISMGSLRENVNPAEDIVLQPFDVISVERAEQVYINGEVAKTGAIELGERDSISLLQALTQAGGLSRDAKRTKVRILRPILNSTKRAMIEIDVNDVYAGKANDFPLLPNDVLYVPRSSVRTVWTTVGQILLTSGPYIIFTLIR